MHSLDNLLVLSPELWLLAGSAVVLVVGRGQAGARPGVLMALLALLGAFLALATQFRSTLGLLGGAFLLDGYAKFFDVILLAAAALTLVMFLTSPGAPDQPSGAAVAFVLLATLGAMLAASSAEMVSLFISLELLSISVVLMGVLTRPSLASAHTAFTYLLSSLVGSAVLIYGLALTYGLSGQTNLRAAGRALTERTAGDPALLLVLALLVAAFAPKLGLVPVHWWVPEVLRGAPLPVAALTWSVAALGAFAVLGRVFQGVFGPLQVAFPLVLAIVAAVTMLYASVAALSQTSIRRFLAFLVIAQVGYGLAAVAAWQRGGISALLLFVLAMAASNVGVFWALLTYAEAIESDRLADLSGMARFAPVPATVLGLSLASSIGIPPLIGFFGRIFVLQAAVQAGFSWLVVVGLLSALLQAFAVLRLIRAAYLDAPPIEIDPVRLSIPVAAGLGLAAAALLVLVLFLGPLYAAAGIGASSLGH